MLVSIHPKNPQERLIEKAVNVVKSGGIIVFPTDTIYALGCDAFNNRAVEQVCRILGKKPEKANLSLICKDLSTLSEFTTPISSATFKLMKRALPGPYTFILNASSNVPKIFKTNKKTVGIRVPDNNICCAIIEALGLTDIEQSDEVSTSERKVYHEIIVNQQKIIEKQEETIRTISASLVMLQTTRPYRES